MADPDTEPNTEPTTLNARVDAFATPSGASDYKFPNDFLGELVLVKPTEYVPVMKTEIGEGPCWRVDVIRVENDFERVDDLLAFPQAIQRTLKKVDAGPNNWTLGRISRGTPKYGPNSAPWILLAAEPEEVAAARDWAESVHLDL